MSSTTVSSPRSGSPTAPWSGANSEQYIQQQLTRTQRQLKLVDLVSASMLLIAGLISFLLLMAVIDHWVVALPVWARWLSLLVLLAGIGGYLFRFVLPICTGRINPVYAARSIEHSDPSLKNSLINFLLFREDRAGVRVAVYQALQRRAAADLSHVHLETAVDYSRMIRLGYILAGILAFTAVYAILAPKSPFQSFARVVAPWVDIERPARVRIEDVQPGAVRVFRGQSLEVSARCYDVREGESVHLYYSTLDDQVTRVPIPMQVESDGLVYRGSLPPDEAEGGIQNDLVYWIEAGDAVTPAFRVQVDPAPAILVEQVEYDYPAYTRLPRRVIENEGDLRAVEGTRVTLRARANQEIAAAVLELDPVVTADATGTANGLGGDSLTTTGNSIEMQFSGSEAWCTFTLSLDDARRRSRHDAYHVRFLSTEQQLNPQPVHHRIEVVPDLAPEIEILTPEKDLVQLPENGSQKIEIRAIDPDFGLHRVRLRAVSGGQSLLDRTLLEETEGYGGQAMARYLFSPAKLGLHAGDEVSYWAVAEDNRTGSDGTPAANITKTRNYTIKIVPGETQAPASPPDPVADPPDDGAADEGSAGSGTAASQDDPSADGSEEAGGGDSADPAESTDPSQDAESPPETASGEQGSGAQSGSEGQDQSSASGTEDGSMGEGSTGAGGSSGGSGDTDESSSGGSSEDGSSSGASGQNSDGGGQRQPGSSGSSSTGDSGGSGDSPSESSSSPGENGSNGGGQMTDDDPEGFDQASEPMHDGEAFERALEHIRRAREQSDSASGAGAESDAQSSEPTDPGPQSPDNGLQSGSVKPSTPPRPGESSGATGQPQPGDAGSQNKSPSGPQSDPPAGAKPSGGGSKDSGSSDDAGGSSDADPQNKSAGSEEQPGEKGTPQAPGDEENKQSGGGDQQKPGSGAGPSKKPKPSGGTGDESSQGSGTPQDKKGKRPKQGGSGGGSPQSGGEQPTPSQSGSPSDSQGAQGGDQSGGGKPGPGQSASKPGSDNAGSSSPGDQGAGAADQSGSGPLANRPGGQKTAPGETGTPGSEPGPGSQTRPATGSTPMPGASNDGSTDSAAPPPAGTGQGAGSKRDGPGMPTGGGQPGQANPQEHTAHGEVPPGEQPNLDYTREATDLVLDYLKDQEQSADEQLLQELNWTPEQMAEFRRRWEALKSQAQEDPRAARELTEALRSLGLRRPQQAVRSVQTQGDSSGTVTNPGSHGQPPAKYAEQFRAFRKGTSRVDRPSTFDTRSSDE